MAYTEEMTTSEILLRLASMRNELLQAVNDIEKISNNICYKAEQTEPQTYVINPQEPTNDDKCFECDDFFTCGGQCNKVEDEPQTNKDFEVTYTCSFTDCYNFKNFGFGEKCIECKRKQSEAKYKDEPQTERSE